MWSIVALALLSTSIIVICFFFASLPCKSARAFLNISTSNPVLAVFSLPTADTLSGLKALKITGATADFIPDETISQTVTGGTAQGTVVSWTLDSGSTTAGVLKYIQTNDAHTDSGVVRAFESNGSNAVSGTQSAGSGNVDTGYSNSLLGSTFASGLATPEIENNSGNVIYIENRRLITRAPDQIEDIKLVIEF